MLARTRRTIHRGRLITLRALRDVGLTPSMFVAPIRPELTDSTEQIDELIGTLADAGAGKILPTPVYLGRGVKDLFFAWLRRQHPELLSTYADLYAHGSHTPRHYRDLVWALVDQALQRHGLPIPDDTTSDNFPARQTLQRHRADRTDSVLSCRHESPAVRQD